MLGIDIGVGLPKPTSQSGIVETIFQPDGTTGQDTWVQEDTPTTAYSANVILSCTVNAGQRRRVLIRILCSSLAGQQAISAFLVLVNNAQPVADRHFNVYAILNNNAGWTPSATWNTKDGTNIWAGDVDGLGGTDAGCSIAGRDFDSSPLHSFTLPAGTPVGTKFYIPLSPALVQEWIDDDNDNHGVVVEVTDGSGVAWRSSNHTTPADRPALVVKHIPIAAASVPDENLTFSDALGYGRFACYGHENWPVIEVTTLDDATPAPAGSLRAAIVASGPRVIVFRVAGTIEVVAQLTISNPYCVILGQTAPGEGICLKSAATNMDAALSIRTHDVIVSNIKSRPGIGGTSVTGDPRYGDAVDAIGNVTLPSIVYNVYIRNVSGSWSVDEVFGFGLSETSAITFERCIMSEPLDLATHSYTAANSAIGHGKCMHISGSTGKTCRDVSVLECIMAHAIDRQPALRLSAGYSDQVSCVIYNWGVVTPTVNGWPWVSLYADAWGDLNANIVNNYYKPGPNSANRQRIYYNHPGDAVGDTMIAYVSGNTDTVLGALSVYHAVPGSSTLTLAGSPLGDAAYGTPLTAAQAFTELVANARCGDWYRLDENGNRVVRSDAVDLRIFDNIANGTGAIIDSPTEVGGWPTLDAGTAWTDSNHDGVPDAWSAANPGASKLDFWWG